MRRRDQFAAATAGKVAELIVTGGAEDPLRTHRREVTVVFLDLRGETEEVGTLMLKGLQKPVPAINVVRLKPGA